MTSQNRMGFNRALALFLSWSMLWVGCAPVTDADLRAALDQSAVKAAKKRGDTDLHVAAGKGDSSATLALIGQKADLNAVNDNDHTPLMLAIRQEQTNTAKLLIAKGAKVDLADEQGDTALHHAVRAGQVEVVRALLGKNAVPNGRNAAKDTPLILATQLDYPEIALLLISQGAQVAVADSHGLIPLHYAANWRRTAVVQELLLKGAGPDVKAPKGQTALMTAAYLGDLSTVNLLIEKGAQVNVRDEQGHMSLHLAAQNGHANVVMALLKAGADLNAVTTAGRTAALFAAQNDHAYLLRDLVQAGARFVPLAETERDIFASALVAQAIAEEAMKQKDIPRSREHYKLATEWFEKAASAYESAANSTDNKLLAKRILIGAALVVGEVALAVLGDMAQRQQAKFQNKQMAQMAALNDAHADGTGTQGYYARVGEYETAYQKAYWSVPTYGNVSGTIPAIPHTQLFLAEEQLRDLYRNTSHQAHEAAQKSARRQNCLKSPAQEAEVMSCLRDIAADSFGPNAMANGQPLQETPKPPIKLDAAAAVKGSALFAGKGACFNCHGKTGKGDGSVAHILNPKPTDLTSKLGLKYQTDVERFNVMKLGIPGTSMVEMKHLSDEEIWLIVAYLKQLVE